MHSPIVKNSSGDLLACAPPVCGPTPSAHVCLDTNDIAYDALFDFLYGAQDTSVPVAVVIHGEKDPFFLRRRYHSIALSRCNRHGLLAHNTSARPQALQCQLGVRVVGGNEGDEIYVGFLQHCRHGRICLDAGKIFLGHLQSGSINFSHRDGCHARALHLCHMEASHTEGAAVADNANSDILRPLKLPHVAFLSSPTEPPRAYRARRSSSPPARRNPSPRGRPKRRKPFPCRTSFSTPPA